MNTDRLISKIKIGLVGAVINLLLAIFVTVVYLILLVCGILPVFVQTHVIVAVFDLYMVFGVIRVIRNCQKLVVQFNLPLEIPTLTAGFKMGCKNFPYAFSKFKNAFWGRN